MKILWLSHFVPWPLRGGARIRSFHLIREAARHNDVRFLGLGQRDLLDDPARLAEARAALEEHCTTVEILPRPSERLPLTKQRVLLKSVVSGATYDETWLRSRELERRLAECVRRQRPDLIHFDTVGLAPYLAATEAAGAVRVLNHHNIESQMMRRRAELAGHAPMRAILRQQAGRLERLEKRSASAFDLHLTVSALDSERLQQIAPGARVQVVSNGVDVDFFAARGPEGRTPESMIFVGALDWYPNRSAASWFLESVLPIVWKERPQATWTLVGRNPALPFVEAAARDPRIVVTGEVDDIRPHVARSRVYVCPIMDGGGTRLKILDTLAQGIPMVTTTMAVEGIDVRDAEHALLADDAEGFASSIVRLFDDAQLGVELARNGRKLVEHTFSWTSIGDRLRSSYTSLCDGRDGDRVD